MTPDLFATLLAVGIPASFLFFVANRLFRLKEMKIRLEAEEVAERAAQYATRNATLDARVRVLEKIVTDGNYPLVDQIEALRRPALAKEEIVQ